jgi:DNA-binding LytR/AlgR family response regulator
MKISLEFKFNECVLNTDIYEGEVENIEELQNKLLENCRKLIECKVNKEIVLVNMNQVQYIKIHEVE